MNKIDITTLARQVWDLEVENGRLHKLQVIPGKDESRIKVKSTTVGSIPTLLIPKLLLEVQKYYAEYPNTYLLLGLASTPKSDEKNFLPHEVLESIGKKGDHHYARKLGDMAKNAFAIEKIKKIVVSRQKEK